MKEENYFILDGKKVPMSEETAESLRCSQKEESPYGSFANNPTEMSLAQIMPFGGDMEYVCQVGFGSVPYEFEGRSLLLRTDMYDWEIIDNPANTNSKLLIAKRK